MRVVPKHGDFGPVAARIALALVIAGSLGLALWGGAHGLPYSFNSDENAHFVPKAMAIFGHGWNTHYFVNPPGYTYVLYAVFEALFESGKSISRQYAVDPAIVFLIARGVAALMLALAVWLLYLAATILFGDRRVGVFAAGIVGFAFLPVFYAHLALNDVPTLAPVCLALVGVALVARNGRLRDLILAGFALGLAAGFKYTSGIVLLPLLAAALARSPSQGGLDRVRMLRLGLPVAALAALAGFLVVNPYALLDFSSFTEGLSYQSSTADDARGKLGLTGTSGVAYYLWSLTWGFGWVPLVAAGAGVVVLTAIHPRIAAILVPAPVVFLIFMGSQERYFGRWLLPIYPILALIAAHAVVTLIDVLKVWLRRVPYAVPVMVAILAAVVWGQGLASSVHIGRVLSREDTRNVTRAWMVEHVPEGAKIVVEPIMPDAWAQDVGAPSPLTSNGNRWVKFPTSRSNIANDGSTIAGRGRRVNIEDYERTLFPKLIERYQEQGYCWVVVGSTQVGRAESEPHAVPRALAYYRSLQRNSSLVFHASPFRAGTKPVPFNFDWSFDYYPREYERPGPEVWVYRLRGGLCDRLGPVASEPKLGSDPAGASSNP